jgi:hypothetical protein
VRDVANCLLGIFPCVPTYVVTKTLGERTGGQAATAEWIEAALTDWGVHVLHKLRMHEKLVFVDDDILWSGSLNSLSFTDTQEVMERHVSRPVVEDYTRILRLETLLATHETQQDRCPVCGGELVVAEARGGDPFYWRCAMPDCYSRSIDQPAPQDGGCRAPPAAARSSSARRHRGHTGDAPSTVATASG